MFKVQRRVSQEEMMDDDSIRLNGNGGQTIVETSDAKFAMLVAGNKIPMYAHNGSKQIYDDGQLVLETKNY